MAFSPLSPRQFQGLANVIVGSATVNPADMAAAAESNILVTIPGVALGDLVIAGPGVAITDGVVWSASVSAANTVKIVFANVTADHVDIASSTWKFIVLRLKGNAAAF